MKNKLIVLFAICALTSVRGFSQDTTHTLQYDKDLPDSNKISDNKISFSKKSSTHKNNTKPMYRDTRLGSSSKMYNTYRKNDYGAGAITTDPTK